MKKELEKVDIVPPTVVTVVGTLSEDRETFIALHNPLDQLVTFKIKPTKRIKVKPRYGYIRSKGESLIKVKAPGMDEGAEAPKKERIKIVVALAPQPAPSSPKQAWNKDSAPEVTLSRKLKVVFQEKEEFESSSASERSSKSSSVKSAKAKKKVSEKKK